jgi:hypothetical protein
MGHFLLIFLALTVFLKITFVFADFGPLARCPFAELYWFELLFLPLVNFASFQAGFDH